MANGVPSDFSPESSPPPSKTTTYDRELSRIAMYVLAHHAPLWPRGHGEPEHTLYSIVCEGRVHASVGCGFRPLVVFVFWPRPILGVVVPAGLGIGGTYLRGWRPFGCRYACLE